MLTMLLSKRCISAYVSVSDTRLGEKARLLHAATVFLKGVVSYLCMLLDALRSRHLLSLGTWRHYTGDS